MTDTSTSANAQNFLADVGEFGVIARITDGVTYSPRVLIGPGDDAALVSTERETLISVDVMVEGRHFRRDWSSAMDVGRRAAAASLADIAAMGGVATAIVVGFSAPEDLPAAWAAQCAAGLREECGLVGAEVVGGDVTAAPVICVSVTAIGHAERVVTRSQAQPGDVVAVCGRLGWAAAGLAILGRGFRAPKVLVDAHRFPQIDYTAGPRAAAAQASSLIDVSDGVIADARHVAQSSGVQIHLRTADVTIDEPVADAASAYSLDPLEWVLTGGDDHAFLATFPPGATIPDGFRVIGEVREGETSGVWVNGHHITSVGGHEHFGKTRA